MDLNRNAQAQPPAHAAPTAGVAGGARKSKAKDDDKMKRVGIVAGIAVVVILLLGVIGVVSFSGDTNAEAKYVDNSKLQAVFLNTGQVYFGKIKELNSKYFVVSNIYYLQTSSTGTATAAQQANTSVSLVKLGCELHEPDDQMLINRDQVTFWENLHDSGQVAQAVKTFVKQNPNGQKCADQSSAAGTNSTDNTQPANNGSTTGGVKSTTTNP